MLCAGIDIGSLSTEVVIINDEEIISYCIISTGSNSREAAEKAMKQALDQAGMGLGELDYIVATGYGRISIPYAQKKITEITCHGVGAHFLFPAARTIIDIGGQDSKVIRVDEEGRVVDFVMNDKCAAGTGRFLEVMAQALEVGLEQMSTLAEKAKRSVSISSMCTVFAESEVVSLIAEGCPKKEIIRGLHDAIADRVVAMVHRVGFEPKLVMSGGVAKNRGVVKSLEQKLKTRITIPPEPQIIGALGAALLARESVIKT